MISPRIDPSCQQNPNPLGQIVRAESGEMCELLHTSPVVQKMHVVEKAGPHYRASLGLFFIGPIVGGAEAQAIFCRRRHQPRRPPLAKIRLRQSGTGDGGQAQLVSQ